jgi:hypothetical protein
MIERFVFHSLPDDYKIGLTKKILLNIYVTNTGENSYDTQCLIHLPAGVEYVSSNSSSTVKKDFIFNRFLNFFLKFNIYCNLMKQSDRIVICHLGNPFLANENVSGLL